MDRASEIRGMFEGLADLEDHVHKLSALGVRGGWVRLDRKTACLDAISRIRKRLRELSRQEEKGGGNEEGNLC